MRLKIKMRTIRMKIHRPTVLNEIPIDGIFDKPQVVITMSTGQWDKLLEAAYDTGAVLLELDDNERPIKAYQMAMHSYKSVEGKKK